MLKAFAEEDCLSGHAKPRKSTSEHINIENGFFDFQTRINSHYYSV
jgi:hypothetical protein